MLVGRLAQGALGILLGILVPLTALGIGPGALARDDSPAARRDDVPTKEHADGVVDYTLRAALDEHKHIVHGDGTIVWRNASTASVQELFFHLYLNAFKNERTLFLRAPVASGRGTSPVAEWGYIDVRKLVARELDGADFWPGADKTSPGDTDDETDIRVPLPRAIAPGETLTLDVTWDAKLPSIVERTGYVDDFHMVAQWFPKMARLLPSGQWPHFPFYHLAEFYADFGTYDVTIDVPTGMRVGATGARVAASSENGRDLLRFRQTDVHDFAWTAWRSFHQKTSRAEGVDLVALYPPGYDVIADREIATVTFALKYFGERYGRYPYPVLTLVHPPSGAGEAGGMEYPTLITCGGAWYGPPFTHDVESVTMHEFGHQYFYGVVATDEQTWPILDEGINSFAEADAMRAWLGTGSALDFMGLQVSLGALFRAGALPAVHNEPIAQSAETFASGADYGGLVYAGTATILDTLSNVYGHEAFARALGRYTRRYRFEHPTLQEFVAVIRENLGDEAAHNLERAISEKGWVDYRVANAISKRDDVAAGVFDREGKRETVERGTPSGATWRGWALVMRHGTLQFPVDVELRGADGTVQVVRWNGAEEWTRIPYEGKSELTEAIVDPLGNVTLDMNLLNNGFRAARPTMARRTLERATYGAALALQWLMP